MSGLILASASSSRRAILKGAAIPFEAVRPGTDEDELKAANPGASPAELALLLAEAKALDVADGQAPSTLILGCDQVLEFGGRPYDKPKSRQELAERLGRMAGKPHHLRGGMVLAKGGRVIAAVSDSATLHMRQLTDHEIEAYLTAAPDWVLGTVGGYALEAEGARLFERVEGDHFSILGLPLFKLLPLLREEGVIAW